MDAISQYCNIKWHLVFMAAWYLFWEALRCFYICPTSWSMSFEMCDVWYFLEYRLKAAPLESMRNFSKFQATSDLLTGCQIMNFGLAIMETLSSDGRGKWPFSQANTSCSPSPLTWTYFNQKNSDDENHKLLHNSMSAREKYSEKILLYIVPCQTWDISAQTRFLGERILRRLVFRLRRNFPGGRTGLMETKVPPTIWTTNKNAHDFKSIG